MLSAVDGFQFEKIAGLRPDLIIGVNSGMKRGDYDKLSRLAPTVPAGKGSTDYFSPWDQQVELIAAALGKPEAGRALVQRIKDDYAEAAAAHPEFAGKTVTFSQNGFYDGLIYVYPDGLNTEFLTMLGFEINPKLTPLIERTGEQVAVSEERMGVLDADVIVFATVHTDGTLAGAIYFISPLSLPYVLERLTPQLEAAAAGKAPQRVVDTAG